MEYSDFECILERLSDAGVTTGIAESSNKEIEYQSHTPASYFTKFVSIDPDFDLPEHDNFEFPQDNVGEDAAEHFLDYVQTVADKIFKKYIKKPKEMIYTEEDKKRRRIYTSTTKQRVAYISINQTSSCEIIFLG